MLCHEELTCTGLLSCAIIFIVRAFRAPIKPKLLIPAIVLALFFYFLHHIFSFEISYIGLPCGGVEYQNQSLNLNSNGLGTMPFNSAGSSIIDTWHAADYSSPCPKSQLELIFQYLQSLMSFLPFLIAAYITTYSIMAIYGRVEARRTPRKK